MRAEKVAVVVAGEISRSPRMLNHLSQLSAAGCSTVALAFAKEPPLLPAGISFRRLRVLPRIGENHPKAIFLIGSAIRMGLLFLGLALQLMRTRPTRILVQNPPAFPTLAAAWIAAKLCRAGLIIDWHNYGFSMLALRLGDRHRFVHLAERYESWMARKADDHLCVSRALAEDLSQRFGIAAHVLYDSPLQLENPAHDESAGKLIAVVPCGWTRDERVGILLDALALLDPDLRHRLCLHLTGDGPLRTKFETRIAALRHAGFEIHTGFLPENDYRALIRSAAIGISLHESASGLDLAMKNIDLIAARVPVCALDYGPTLAEQIREEENGFLFRGADDLARLLAALLRDPTPLAILRKKMAQNPPPVWESEWRRVALPSILRVSPPG